MTIYEIKVLRDQLLTSDTANTYDEAVRILKQRVSAYRTLYGNARVICNTDSKFELTEGNQHMCIWIEKSDTSKLWDALEKDMARFM